MGRSQWVNIMFLFKNHKDDSFFNDIYGKKLDKYQKKVVLDDSERLLVIAGAGSGKTLTIVGKIKYLIEKKNIKEREILCLSFTNETVNNLIEKVHYNVSILTFHKLALQILSNNNFFSSSCLFWETSLSWNKTIDRSLSKSLFALLLKKSFTFSELISSLSPYNLDIFSPKCFDK